MSVRVTRHEGSTFWRLPLPFGRGHLASVAEAVVQFSPAPLEWASLYIQHDAGEIHLHNIGTPTLLELAKMLTDVAAHIDGLTPTLDPGLGVVSVPGRGSPSSDSEDAR